MNEDAFIAILEELCSELTVRLREGEVPTSSKGFEAMIRESLSERHNLSIDFHPHPHVFPDIVIPPFGIEVKFIVSDTWRSVANSVFESSRHPGVKEVYLVFGKAGGEPEVRWGRYGECVVHVRTSHVPRFEVEIDPSTSLFSTMGLSYLEFSTLSEEEKMGHIRKYARSRLRKGERLWWLEGDAEPQHSLPIQARLYKSLSRIEKRKLRAEAALLCPQILGSSRMRTKYDDATLYLLTYHGVLASQIRDLFTAGSVALVADAKRGGNYLLRALKDIESEMIEAAEYLDSRLFEEYWGEEVAAEHRIGWWLSEADRHACGWRPSDELFLDL